MQGCKIDFRGKKIDYFYDWIDNVTFRFDFGDGVFIDKDGDSYFIHVEYHKDTDEFIFEFWYEDDYIPAPEEELKAEEREYLKTFISLIC